MDQSRCMPRAHNSGSADPSPTCVPRFGASNHGLRGNYLETIVACSIAPFVFCVSFLILQRYGERRMVEALFGDGHGWPSFAQATTAMCSPLEACCRACKSHKLRSSCDMPFIADRAAAVIS